MQSLIFALQPVLVVHSAPYGQGFLLCEWSNHVQLLDKKPAQATIHCRTSFVLMAFLGCIGGQDCTRKGLHSGRKHDLGQESDSNYGIETRHYML
eukprot:scaffold16736_cov22-Tisochrysis_lutea.AAC.6